MPPLLPFAQHRHHGKLMHVPLLILAYNTCPELPHLSTSSHLTFSPSHSLSTTIPPSYALRASQLYVCYWRMAHLTCHFDSLHPHPITSLHLLHLLSSLTDLPQLYPSKLRAANTFDVRSHRPTPLYVTPAPANTRSAACNFQSELTRHRVQHGPTS